MLVILFLATLVMGLEQRYALPPFHVRTDYVCKSDYFCGLEDRSDTDKLCHGLYLPGDRFAERFLASAERLKQYDCGWPPLECGGRDCHMLKGGKFVVLPTQWELFVERFWASYEKPPDLDVLHLPPITYEDAVLYCCAVLILAALWTLYTWVIARHELSDYALIQQEALEIDQAECVNRLVAGATAADEEEARRMLSVVKEAEKQSLARRSEFESDELFCYQEEFEQFFTDGGYQDFAFSAMRQLGDFRVKERGELYLQLTSQVLGYCTANEIPEQKPVLMGIAKEFCRQHVPRHFS